MEKNNPLIILNNVDYAYNQESKALDDINLNIYSGEVVGIMGQNGAGKTTLIRTLNGLIRPSSGNVFIRGKKLQSKTIAQLSAEVGIIFQNPALQLFSNSVEDELKFSLNNLGISKKKVEEKTEYYLDLFNLKRYRTRSPLNLSGGETKKLATATILCRNPEILVFDEPTLGQDSKEIRFFVNLITKQKELGKTIIIVTHNIEFALEYIPRTILMADGKIIADGPTDRILTNKKLIKKTSLIFPQIHEFCLELRKNGIPCPDDILLKEDMIQFLSDFLKKP
ncbi:MAG: energy-coupling factor ABC transporter ATP-binding protein [archaeon]